MSKGRRSRSRRLVVDSCVAQSAGETEHPVSSACRRFLMDILEICHEVVLPEEIWAEWNRHQSAFTRKWRVSMAGRKKPISRISADRLKLDTSACSVKDRGAVGKDRCLLEAALAADKVIVTRDTALLEALASVPGSKKIVSND